MRQAQGNPPIKVQPVTVHAPRAGEVQGRKLAISHRTALFRQDVYLAAVLGLAVERVPDPRNFALASVACSNFAEGDSLLALYNEMVPDGTATITGIDASRSAIKAARGGRYKLHRASWFDTKGQSYEERFLRSKGFTTSYEPNDRQPHRGAIVADAASVRRGHIVRLIEHDAAATLPVAGEVDLACGNNLLYHLDPDKAMRIACNMGSILSDRGVLSFGTNITLSNGTRESIDGELRDRFDLEPVLPDIGPDAEHVMVYARP